MCKLSFYRAYWIGRLSYFYNRTFIPKKVLIFILVTSVFSKTEKSFKQRVRFSKLLNICGIVLGAVLYCITVYLTIHNAHNPNNQTRAEQQEKIDAVGDLGTML